MNVSVIVPIYNGEGYIESLFKKIREQKNIEKIEIIAPVSPSKDESFEIAKKYADIAYEVKNFNHGKTRHEAAEKSSGDYLIFITQDIMPYDDLWLYNLIKDLDSKTVAAFSKQIAYLEHGLVEKMIREFNYPDEKRICNLENTEKNGRKNIFYSDASSAVRREEFFKLGGYDFTVPTNEDVVFVNNIIKTGKTFIYQPESKVWHSHKLNFKDTYERYRAIGRFEKFYEKEIDFSGTGGEGKKLLKKLITELLKKGKIGELINLICDMGIRFIGYRSGRR